MMRIKGCLCVTGPSKHVTSERRSDHVCITSISSEPLLEVYWTCKTGSISERLKMTHLGRLWTCKTGSISERLKRTHLGRLWTCKTSSISERLMGTRFVCLWTCKTSSISERLMGTPLGRLLDMQNCFNI